MPLCNIRQVTRSKLLAYKVRFIKVYGALSGEIAWHFQYTKGKRSGTIITSILSFDHAEKRNACFATVVSESSQVCLDPSTQRALAPSRAIDARDQKLAHLRVVPGRRT